MFFFMSSILLSSAKSTANHNALVFSLAGWPLVPDTRNILILTTLAIQPLAVVTFTEPQAGVTVTVTVKSISDGGLTWQGLGLARLAGGMALGIGRSWSESSWFSGMSTRTVTVTSQVRISLSQCGPDRDA